MKIKILYILVGFLCQNGFAQKVVSGVSVQGGGSLIVNPDPIDIKSVSPKLSFSVGLFHYARLSNHLFFKPGLNFSVKGTNGREQYALGATRYDDRYRIHYYYLELPLEVTYHHSYRLISFFGPYYAYRIAGSEEVNGKVLAFSKGQVKVNDFGLGGGLIYRLTDKVKLGIRTQYGLVDTSYPLFDVGTSSSPAYLINNFYGKNFSAKVFLEIDFRDLKDKVF